MSRKPRTEEEMREEKVPCFPTLNDLSEYIRELETQEHDYGTAAYAMSMASDAAFNYIASKLGVSGFQAGFASMDVIRRLRGLKCPFILLIGEDMLYPQYSLPKKLKKAMGEWKKWARDEARKKLASSDSATAHPHVRRRWEELAGIRKKKTKSKSKSKSMVMVRVRNFDGRKIG